MARLSQYIVTNVYMKPPTTAGRGSSGVSRPITVRSCATSLPRLMAGGVYVERNEDSGRRSRSLERAIERSQELRAALGAILLPAEGNN